MRRIFMGSLILWLVAMLSQPIFSFDFSGLSGLSGGNPYSTNPQINWNSFSWNVPNTTWSTPSTTWGATGYTGYPGYSYTGLGNYTTYPSYSNGGSYGLFFPTINTALFSPPSLNLLPFFNPSPLTYSTPYLTPWITSPWITPSPWPGPVIQSPSPLPTQPGTTGTTGTTGTMKPEPAKLFEVEDNNSYWHHHSGFYIDDKGNLYTFAYSFFGYSSSGNYKEKFVKTITPSVLAEKKKLIEPASMETCLEGVGRDVDAGIKYYSCYQFDPATGKDKKIELQLTGEFYCSNQSEAADALVSWLKEIEQGLSGSDYPSSY